MGTDTHLYVHPKYDYMNLMDLIKSVTGNEVKLRTCDGMPEMYQLSLTYKKTGRTISVHQNTTEIPTGLSTLLSLSMDDHAHSLFRALADRIGGILELNDCDPKAGYEFYRGKDYSGDGDAYDFRQRVLNGECK